MKIEELRRYYVTARNAVIDGVDDKVVIQNITKLYDYVENLFERGSILDRVKSKQLYNILSILMDTIRMKGLKDPEVLSFFGLKPQQIPQPVAADPVAANPAEANPIFDGLSPIEEAPVVVDPIEEAPVIVEPVEEAPVVVDPVEEAPVIVEPVEEAPVIVEPVEEEPVAVDPAEGADASGDDIDDPNRVKAPEMLDDFIGQAQIVARLKKEIAVAKSRNIKHLQNILFFGGRGLGKTTLMHIIANELGVEFEWIDASQFSSSHTSEKQFINFLQRVSDLKRPVVIGIDEIHALPGKIQSALLTLLQSREFVHMDASGQNHRIPIKEFTFIGATTDPQDVLVTIKDRCANLTFTLQDYTHDELMLIFKKKFASKKLKISDALIERCIPRCRCSIREVEAIVIGLLTEADYLGTNIITESILENYFKERGIDEVGLRQQDIDVLRALASDMSGILSADTLASKLGLDVKVLLSEYEPYLLKLGFITVINRGRAITDKGRAHLRKLDGDDDGSADADDNSGASDSAKGGSDNAGASNGASGGNGGNGGNGASGISPSEVTENPASASESDNSDANLSDYDKFMKSIKGNTNNDDNN